MDCDEDFDANLWNAYYYFEVHFYYIYTGFMQADDNFMPFLGWTIERGFKQDS